MTTAMAQHLLLAADRYQLIRLRTMCERRLCDSVDVDSVATTLMLADKSNASKLRQARPSPRSLSSDPEAASLPLSSSR